MNKRGRSLIIKLFLISLVVIIIFLIAGSILALESDNIKEYNPETKTVTISDKITKQNIVKITLDTPLNNYVMRGKDRKVAEFTIESFEDYDNAFNNLEFYDIKKDMQKINREFVYKYKEYYDVEVDDFEEICKEREKDDGNGTYIEYYDCYENKIGSHVEKRFSWENFNKESQLNKGTITLGIFTDVYPNDNVEWIPTLFNTKINEWAGWTEVLNVDLVAYYKLDETSGYDAESSTGKHDLITANDDWVVNGLIEGGLSFAPTNSTNKAYNDSLLNKTQGDLTISMWVKSNDEINSGTTSQTIIQAPEYSDDNRMFLMFWTGAIYFSFEGQGADHHNIYGITDSWSKDVWYHIVIRWSVTDNNVSVFKDTLTECSYEYSNPYDVSNLARSYEKAFTIGGGGGYESFNGTIDEVGIWDRSLSDSEISDLWNNGAGISYSGSINPNVTINTPTNTTYPTSSIDFNVTAVDDTAIDSCWASIDSGVTNLTLLNTTHNDQYNSTNTTVPDGSYTAYFYCNDSSNNVNNTEQEEFTVNTPPTIPTLLEPENETGSAMNSTITFTWSNSTDASGDTITYDLEIYNHSDMGAENLTHSNTSIAEGVANTSINIKLSDYTTVDGDYYWRVRANDSVRASDWSSNWTFQYANWSITFNVTDAWFGNHLSDIETTCTNGWDTSGFPGGDANSPFTTGDVFAPIVHNCTFSITGYFENIQTFTPYNDTTIVVEMIPIGGLTPEEHTWLEAIYDCIIGEDCSLYNLLLEINSTVGNIWEHTKPTDESVITSETITNKVVNSTNNLTIDYTVSIPIKAGYSIGAYLPVRIGFWFLNESNTTCHNQGDRPEGVDDPYCQPLIIETIGPMGGEVNFTVELQPSLPAGNYSIKRIIDIDPLGVWYNYGQEIIGMFTLTESLIDSSIDLERTGESMPNMDGEQSSSSSTNSESSGSSSRKTTIIKEREIITFVPQDETEDETEEIINLNKPSITGATIGPLLTSGNLMFIIAMICITFIVFLVVTSRTIIKTSKNK